MDDHRNRDGPRRRRRGPADDPVLDQGRKDDRKRDELAKAELMGEKEKYSDFNIRPSMMTRFDLGVVPPTPIGVKYIMPVPNKVKKAAVERRRRKEDERNFCRYAVTKIPNVAKAAKVEYKLAAPSAEIKEVKVMPRKASITASEAFPEQDRKELAAHKPKSGTMINVKKKRRVKKKGPPAPPEIDIQDLIAAELATIDEMGGEDEGFNEDYLTRQFRRRVAQMSRTTSVNSADTRIPPPMEGEEGEEEGEEIEGEVEEEEDQFVNALAQKFRRESEIRRYERPRRKTKPGTFENFSFTRLRQPTLKSFYYGIKMATIHDGDAHFPSASRGRQGICMPVAAYCFSILKHPDRWTQADIDDVLEAGNDLFLECIGQQHMHGDNVELRVGDLQKYCKLGARKVRFEVSEPEVSGMVRSDDKKVYNLTKAINVFFGRYSAGILQTDTVNVALWKDKHYYFFDSTPRTLDLFSNPYGTALMANFYDTTSIVSVLLNRSNLENVPFVIYSIRAYKVLQRDAEEVESKEVIAEADNYQVLDEEKAVALGSFDLADKCFGFSRNKQELTIAMVALVYSKITPPSSWHRSTVDKIVIIGNQLFLECIESDEIEEVTVDDLPAVFTIGPYVVDVCISARPIVDFMFKKSICMLTVRLEKFFETNSNALVRIGVCAVAVWKQRNMYHCFDPYSRNNEGLKCRDGAACISMHTTLPSLTAMVTTNFDEKDTIFYVHAMKVCKIHRDPARNDLFPKTMTMNEYPIEHFKRHRMRRGRRKAVVSKKMVTVDQTTRAALCEQQPQDGSILDVGSTVRSLGPEELPPMCHKSPSRILRSMPPPDKEFIADLDSPSLSDTQIEPPPLEEPEGETVIEFIDLDGFELTQEEQELQERGEGEGGEGDEEGGDNDEGEDDEKGSKDAVEAEMARESQRAEGAEDDWYMAMSDYTQIGSQSLLSRVSQEMNTEYPPIEVPDEEVPAASRNLGAIVRRQRRDAEADKYECRVGPTEEDEINMWEEYMKETNFVNLPDNSQVVMGTKNMAAHGDELEIMAPFICIMATAVARKYAIDSWSTDIVDYVLKCGSELFQNANTRFDQNYKLEIAKITLGSTDLSIKVDYVFDTYIKSRVLAAAIDRMLFPRCPAGIMVTPTYSCAIFLKNRLYYLFDGFGNNEVGLSKGPGNEGVACFARFTNVDHLVARILHNKSKREQEENIEYDRFVLSSCHVRRLPKGEGEGAPAGGGADADEMAAAGGQAEDGAPSTAEPVDVRTYKKKKGETRPEKPPRRGYRKTEEGLDKILGSKGLGGEKDLSDYLKEDYFVCLCACLLLLNNPLGRWDETTVDTALDQGVHVFEHADDINVSTKKFVKNILIEDHIFDIVIGTVKFQKHQARRSLRIGLQTMVERKRQHFLVQFPNRCYAVSQEADAFHVFDPSDPNGQASWTRYSHLGGVLQRLRSGVVEGGEAYNFHSFEITSIGKAPRTARLAGRGHRYHSVRDRREEPSPPPGGRPFHEECHWLHVDPIPWSWRVDKSALSRWNNWFTDIPDDLFSLFGSLSPLDDVFPSETKGKQTLGNLVVAIGMTQIYELCDWNAAVLDSILLSGNAYFHECIKDITNENYEVAFEDINKECKVFPYKFRVRFLPVVEGTMFLIRLKQFNLYKALRMFFDDYERRYGVICVTKTDEDRKLFAFGKVQEGEYFLYDCETLGPPMFVEKGSGVPYVLRTTTLNRLLHVMTLTLRGGDFYIFDVGLSELKSIAA